MTNEEILKKIIKQAVKNGWEVRNGFYDGDKSKMVDFMLNDIDAPDYREFIFSNDFAKAFWGEAKHIYRESGKRTCLKTVGWQYHQHKILDEIQAGREPLKYLEKFL